jgi:hypothetical protein
METPATISCNKTYKVVQSDKRAKPTGSFSVHDLLWQELPIPPHQPREYAVNSSGNTDLSKANAELKTHIPLLIRWGVACLMVIVALVMLAGKGEGEVNFAIAATFIVLWLVCLLKAAQSAFIVVAGLVDRAQS